MILDRYFDFFILLSHCWGIILLLTCIGSPIDSGISLEGIDMDFNFKALAALCSVAVSLTSGCQSGGISDTDRNNISPMLPYEETSDGFGPEQVTGDDLALAVSEDAQIIFSADGISFDASEVERKGYAAVIKSGGVYRISGSMPEGRIVVDCDNPVSLIFDGADIQSVACLGNAPLKLTVPGDTYNSISGDKDICGISSTGDVTINGGGTLAIAGNNAISCGALKLCGGNIDMESWGDGIVSSRYVIHAGGSTTIRSGGKGLMIQSLEYPGYINMSGGSLDIVSDSDGICSSDGIFIENGYINILSGGGSGAVLHFGLSGSHPTGKHGGFSTDGSFDFDFDDLTSGDGSRVINKKGINTDGIIEINGGRITIDSADDGISAHKNIDISGGMVSVKTGDDGIHCDGEILISDGDVDIIDSYIALEGMSVVIKGGKLMLVSYYDGINAAGGNNITSSGAVDGTDKYVSISGGKVFINAAGDGIDSAGTAAISGGEVIVFSGDADKFASLNYNGSFALSGGKLAAFGSDALTKAPSIVYGSCISVYAKAPKGSMFAIKDDKNDIVFEAEIRSDCSSVIFSCGDIIIGNTYYIYADDIMLGSVTAAEGICGDGPSGRNTGTFNDVTSGDNGNKEELVA